MSGRGWLWLFIVVVSGVFWACLLLTVLDVIQQLSNTH